MHNILLLCVYLAVLGGFALHCLAKDNSDNNK